MSSRGGAQGLAMDQESRCAEGTVTNNEGSKMRIPAAIVLATLIATPATAIDIVSGSGAVVKNGAGLTVVNGDPCSGRMEAACLDREGDRLRNPDIAAPEPVGGADEPQDPKDCVSASCEGYYDD